MKKVIAVIVSVLFVLSMTGLCYAQAGGQRQAPPLEEKKATPAPKAAEVSKEKAPAGPGGQRAGEALDKKEPAPKPKKKTKTTKEQKKAGAVKEAEKAKSTPGGLAPDQPKPAQK
jgi:hypothetical protein